MSSEHGNCGSLSPINSGFIMLSISILNICFVFIRLPV